MFFKNLSSQGQNPVLLPSSGSINMKFIKIPAGEFMMGSSKREKGLFSNESPVHKIIIRKPFLLGKYPVTQKDWKVVMGSNPSALKGDDLPVELISWYDAQKFIEKLNQMEGTDIYRLPSEAEWEYACRAGTTTRYSFGDNESELGDYAWYWGNSGVCYLSDLLGFFRGPVIHPVGQKKPNPWGLYDMYGNGARTAGMRTITVILVMVVLGKKVGVAPFVLTGAEARTEMPKTADLRAALRMLLARVSNSSVFVCLGNCDHIFLYYFAHAPLYYFTTLHIKFKLIPVKPECSEL